MQPPPALFEVAGSSGSSRVPAREGPVLVGRSSDNDIVLSGEPTVSRHHAELLGAGEQWAVRDLGSHNGTHVNGVRLDPGEVRDFGPSDVIAIGNVTIRVIAELESDGMTIEDASALAPHRLLTALSKREREVLALVATGRTDDQVAAELYISIKTVHSHLDRIRDKTGLRRRAELTRLAVRLGLSAPNAP
jgi:DNA-binding CsgD family transcriptional regulator